MLIASAGSALLMLQTQAARIDTIVVLKTVAADKGWLETVAGIASILISIALLALAIGLIPAAWNFRKSYKKVNELLDRIYGDVTPLVRHASTIADNMNYISTSARVDIQRVNETIATANERMQSAVRSAERRARELDAFLDVVQSEAESTFVSAASALRGLREGAATFSADQHADLAHEPDEEMELDMLVLETNVLAEMAIDDDDTFSGDEDNGDDTSGYPSIDDDEEDDDERPRVRARRATGGPRGG